MAEGSEHEQGNERGKRKFKAPDYSGDVLIQNCDLSNGNTETMYCNCIGSNESIKHPIVKKN